MFTRCVVIVLLLALFPAIALAEPFEQSRARLQSGLQARLSRQVEMQLAILATAHLREQVVAFNARTGNGPEKQSEAVAGATRSWLRCSLERSIPECTRASRVPLLAGHDRGEATALPAAPAR